jgi:hypothetical protein
VEVDHHVEELELICQSSECRLQCIGAVYIYLRDMANKNWHCNSLQNKRNMELYERTTGRVGPREGNIRGGGYDKDDSDDDSEDDKDFDGWACYGHCGTYLHSGGKELCPWSQQTKDEARKSGGAAMRKLAKPKKKTRGGKGKKKDDK